MLSIKEKSQLSKEQAQSYASMSPEQKAAFADATRSEKRGAANNGPLSSMQQTGILGSFIAAMGTAILLMTENFELAIVTASLCGFLVFVWLLGTIELRLIEIRDAIANKAD